VTKSYRSIPADELLATFSPARQKKIATRSAELIADELALRTLRQSKNLTQTEVARKLGGRQVYISRLEKRSDMKLSTLRDYVGAIGGKLELVVTFPEGTPVKLATLGASKQPRGSMKASTPARGRRVRRAAKSV
jgi:predicted DNA-binding protein (UPF0251 family)